MKNENTMNITKSIIALCCALMAMWTPAAAQDKYMSSERYEDADQIDGNPADYGVLLISTTADLVVTTPDDKVDLMVSAPQPREGGLYEYVVSVVLSKPQQLKLEVSRRGSISATEFVVKLRKPDVLYAYRINEVNTPITYEDHTGSTDFIASETHAAVEFIVSGYNLVLDYSEKLQAKKVMSANKADKTKMTTTLEYPIAVVNGAYDRMVKAEEERVRYEKELNAKSNTTEAEEERLDALKDVEEAAVREWNEINTIRVSVEGSNELAVSVCEEGAKAVARVKKCYAVLPLTREKDVSESAGFMRNAGTFFTQRLYQSARESFVSAMKAKDCPANMKSVIKVNINDCDTCIHFDQLYKFAVTEFAKFKKQKVGKQSEVAYYLNTAIYSLKKLDAKNPCDYYKNGIARIEKELGDMPMQIQFSVNEWRNMQSGAAMQGVTITAHYKSDEAELAKKAATRKQRKAMQQLAAQGVVLGTTDSNGVSTLDLDRNNLPYMITLSAPGASTQVYRMVDIERKAVGTYLKRTIHLHMSVR